MRKANTPLKQLKLLNKKLRRLNPEQQKAPFNSWYQLLKKLKVNTDGIKGYRRPNLLNN